MTKMAYTAGLSFRPVRWLSIDLAPTATCARPTRNARAPTLHQSASGEDRHGAGDSMPPPHNGRHERLRGQLHGRGPHLLAGCEPALLIPPRPELPRLPARSAQPHNGRTPGRRASVPPGTASRPKHGISPGRMPPGIAGAGKRTFPPSRTTDTPRPNRTGGRKKRTYGLFLRATLLIFAVRDRRRSCTAKFFRRKVADGAGLTIRLRRPPETEGCGHKAP